MSKATIATVKGFIRRGLKAGNLAVRVKSDFDGRIDCVSANEDQDFHPARLLEGNCIHSHNLGVAGVYFVGGGRDYVIPQENGFEVSNCCGDWEVKMI